MLGRERDGGFARAPLRSGEKVTTSRSFSTRSTETSLEREHETSHRRLDLGYFCRNQMFSEDGPLVQWDRADAKQYCKPAAKPLIHPQHPKKTVDGLRRSDETPTAPIHDIVIGAF